MNDGILRPKPLQSEHLCSGLGICVALDRSWPTSIGMLESVEQFVAGSEFEKYSLDGIILNVHAIGET